MTSALDVDLNDGDLITEIHLLADLMVIASESTGSLDTTTIDAALGVGVAEGVDIPQQRVAC